MNFFLLEAVE